MAGSSEEEELGRRIAQAEAERDYYRQVAQRLGQKSLTDAQDFTSLIENLRQTEERLRATQAGLERTVAERTAELMSRNEELRQITRRYDELVRRIPVGVYTLRTSGDGSLLRFEYLSPRLCRILSLDPESLPEDPRWSLELAHPEDRAEFETTIRQATRNPAPFRWEGRFMVREEVRWVRIESDPVQTPEGEVLWSGVLSDITVRRQTEEKLRESEKNAELERLKLQKMEAIGTLAGGLAHDFNNLLQGVFGYIALARLSLNEPQAAASMLEQAERAINQAVHLTSQLLTFAKGGKPLKKPVLLKKPIEEAARFALSGSSSSCRISIAPDLWFTDADEGQIGQVIQNMVLNAVQAMQHSGTVELVADNVTLPRGSDSALAEGGRFVRIRIADSGIGIPVQYLSRVFDPYFSTKQKGSGLGLATCYSIVKRHDGAITVLSEPGIGTTFCVYLPALERPPQEEPAQRPAPPEAPAAGSGSRGLVLVMDDEEMVRAVAGKMLELLGYQVAYARDGQEAIDKLCQGSAAGRPFDVAILDLTVRGGMGGEEAIARIRELVPGVKAIVSSGYSDNAVVSDFRAYGFDAYLNKPYTALALKESLAALLGEGARAGKPRAVATDDGSGEGPGPDHGKTPGSRQ